MRTRQFTLFFLFCFFTSALMASSADIVVTQENLGQRYLVTLKLHSDDFELELPDSDYVPDYGPSNGYKFLEDGRFKVFVKKDAFPVALKEGLNFKYIALGMSWTNLDTKAASIFINEKKIIFDELARIKKSQSESLTVTVGLCFFIEVLSEEPLDLRLTIPHVYFRQFGGRYINNTEPLKPGDYSFQEWLCVLISAAIKHTGFEGLAAFRHLLSCSVFSFH